MITMSGEAPSVTYLDLDSMLLRKRDSGYKPGKPVIQSRFELVPLRIPDMRYHCCSLLDWCGRSGSNSLFSSAAVYPLKVKVKMVTL